MSAPNNQLPAILNVATIPTINNMNIKTEVLDPITITNKQAVFMIPKTGILDGGSMVQLGITADPKNFFPLNTGIHGLIRSCFLKVGGKVIASNDDYAYYTTMTRQFETPEHRAYVDMVKSGACGDRWAEVESGRIGYRDLVATVNAGDPLLTNLVVPEFIRPTQSDATTPLFSVPLSTLIPMMRSRQLPLLAIKEHIYLEINFNEQAANQQGTITCVQATHNNLSAVKISQPNIKFISDHLYYTNDQMDNVVRQTLSDQGLSILYEDLITTYADVPAVNVVSGVVPQSIERQIAVSGRTVRNILIQEKVLNQNHAVLGQYRSSDLVIPSQYNFRINDQRIYDRNVQAPPRKYNEVAGVMGKPLMVPNQMYSYDVDSDKQDNPLQRLNQNSVYIGKIDGHQMPNSTNTTGLDTNDLRNTSHYIGYDATTTGFNVLGNGAKIGVKPIIINRVYSRQANAAGPPQVIDQSAARQMRIYTGVERVMVLKNGEITLSA
tara:strand:+ start:180 stop:1661 length:1482 start_codon:yes stop_codon:yes gene_type:complete